MKNLLSISLIIIYLFGNTEFCQVFNISHLLDHYKQHRAFDHKLYFSQFLVMHYCTDDGTAADEQDSKLPLKQLHQFGFIFFTAPAEQNFLHTNFNAVTKEKNTHFAFQNIEPVYLGTPIHPPRFI